MIKKESMRYATQQRYPQFQCHCRGITNGYFAHFRLPSSSKQKPKPLKPKPETKTRNHYCSLKADLMVDIVGRAMPRNDFGEILRFLHVANSQRLDRNDRMGKLRPMMNHLQDVFQKAHIPEQHLSFYESMIAYYGRHGCKQFIRGKPTRFGLYASPISSAVTTFHSPTVTVQYFWLSLQGTSHSLDASVRHLISARNFRCSRDRTRHDPHDSATNRSSARGDVK